MTSKSASQTLRKLTLLSIFALIGAGISAFQSYHFFTVRSGAGGFQSFCHISQKMNCDIVEASRYAELIPGVGGGIPLSSFATGWFVALFFITLLARAEDWRRDGIRAALLMSVVGSFFSVIYLGVMVGVLKTFCLLCLGVDATNLILLGISATANSQSARSSSGAVSGWQAGHLKTAAGIIAASLIVSIALLQQFNLVSMKDTDATEAAQSVLSTPPVAVEAGPELPQMGPKAAPITVVEFSDFQCPFCRMGALTLNTLENRYPGKIRIVFRNYPLDPTCNHYVPHGMHPNACEAARVGVCANAEGKFASVYRTFFENQESFAPGKLAQIAASAGADPAQLASCVNTPSTQAAIERDIDEANRLGVTSTPIFFINGHKMEGAWPLPVWEKIVDALLAGQP